ncbi:MAG TPA: hypothetical protein DC057_05400 [Spirochaetia bacterium]|nr:hypothetical protein [Spirochaetia bacterium]
MKDILKSDLVNKISSSLSNFNLAQLSKEQLESIAKLLIVDKAKDEMKSIIKKNNFDYDLAKSNWLKSFKAKNTVKIYSKALDLFADYLKKTDTHILDVIAKDVDLFIISLDVTNLGNSSKRLYIISALSSFFSKLLRWDYISHNYIKGSKLPKKERGRELKVPTQEEVDLIRNVILNYENAKGKGHHKVKEVSFKALAIIDLFIETGLRVGGIKTIKVGINGKITGNSKGKTFELQLSVELAKRLQKLVLENISEISVQKIIEKACKRAGVKSYSCHSFRHFFAINHYLKNMDIYRLKELLNHSSISITENYLKSLKVI